MRRIILFGFLAKNRILATLLVVCTVCTLTAGGDASTPSETAVWQSPARLHRLFLRKPIRGNLIVEWEGIEFRSPKFSGQWPFLEIHTFQLSNRGLTLTTYQNRRWHEPGEQRFHFTLTEEIPPAVAAMIQESVDRPARNGAPDPKAPAIVEMPARHPTRFGGSNGTLRLRKSGIDYVTSDGRDSHSWRWSDIQTIANPDPYSFRVTAYREIAEFELKQPLSRELFEELWSRLYASDLNVSAGSGGDRQ